MRITCPACQAETSLDALFGREADGRAFAHFVDQNLVLGPLLVRYIALFRPAKRRLSLARTMSLLDDLLPDLQRGAITRKGRDWPASHAVWRAAIEQVLAARDKGTLTLPLTSHGYLLEVVMGHADKAEAVAEREREQAVRGRAHTGGPGHAAGNVAAYLGATHAGVAPAPPPYDPSKGPSRSALATRAQAEALKASRRGHWATDQPEGTTP